MQQLIRWSGITSIWGGVSVIAYQFSHSERNAEAVLNNPYTVVHLWGVISYLILTLGLIGAYLKLAERMKTKGLVSFIMALFGTILWLAGLLVDGFLNPVMAHYDPNLLTAAHGSGAVHHNPFGAAGIYFPLQWLLMMVGYTLFGIQVMKSGIFPKWSGICLMIGGILIGPSLLFPIQEEVVGAIFLGIGYIGLGRSMSRTTYNSMR